MNIYEQLLAECDRKGIAVDEGRRFRSANLAGLYIDGNIALSDQLRTTKEKACVLAEEIGHHDTSEGCILDPRAAGNSKQEHQARIYAYDRLIGLSGLLSAFEAGCRNRYEIAEHLNVTESFLADALEAYRGRYGAGTEIGDYYIGFIPALHVIKKL